MLFVLLQAKSAEEALSNIAGQGLLGSLLVLAIAAGIYMFRGWMKEKDERSNDRVTDRKEFTEALQKNNEGIKSLAVEALRTQDGMKSALANLEKETREQRLAREKESDELRAQIAALQQEQVRLVAELNTRLSRPATSPRR